MDAVTYANVYQGPCGEQFVGAAYLNRSNANLQALMMGSDFGWLRVFILKIRMKPQPHSFVYDGVPVRGTLQWPK